MAEQINSQNISYRRYLMNPNPKDIFNCDNCNKRLYGRELNGIRDLLVRLDIGGEVPGGECPECGSLCYLKKEN